MKIQNIETFVVDCEPSADGWTETKPFIFVKIKTDEGIIGWGEAYSLSYQQHSIALLIKEIGVHLIGTNPLDVRQFAHNAFTQIAEKRHGLSFFCAMSSLEIALWDICGKVRSLPVFELLGRSDPNPVRLYANFWSVRDHPIDAIADKALEYKEMGFTAVKIYPFRCKNLDESERLVKKVRETIGSDTDLMIDLSGDSDPVKSLQATLRFAQYNPYWVEEPVASHDIDNLEHITRSTPVRIVTGERLAGKHAFREILKRNAANILNPDIAACGGILTFLEIAAMADAFSVEITPHNYNSMSVAQAAMLQVSTLSSNCKYAEYFPYFQAASDAISVNPIKVNKGYAELPKTPGIGIELDESELLARSVLV